jgi:hypothetical protein
MKRVFGVKLIEVVLPRLDLTHVVDCSGIAVPAHGTPTVCRATIKVRIPDNQDEKVVAGLVPQGGRSPTGGASSATTGDKALSRASIVM